MTTGNWKPEFYSDTPSLEDLLPIEPQNFTNLDNINEIVESDELLVTQQIEPETFWEITSDITNSSLYNGEVNKTVLLEPLDDYDESTTTSNLNDYVIGNNSDNLENCNNILADNELNLTLKNCIPIEYVNIEYSEAATLIGEEAIQPSEYPTIPQIVHDIGEYNKNKLQNEAEKLLTQQIIIQCVTPLPEKPVVEEIFTDTDFFSIPTVEDIGIFNKTRLHKKADELLKSGSEGNSVSNICKEDAEKQETARQSICTKFPCI